MRPRPPHTRFGAAATRRPAINRNVPQRAPSRASSMKAKTRTRKASRTALGRDGKRISGDSDADQRRTLIIARGVRQSRRPRSPDGRRLKGAFLRYKSVTRPFGRQVVMHGVYVLVLRWHVRDFRGAASIPARSFVDHLPDTMPLHPSCSWSGWPWLRFPVLL